MFSMDNVFSIFLEEAEGCFNPFAPNRALKVLMQFFRKFQPSKKRRVGEKSYFQDNPKWQLQERHWLKNKLLEISVIL